MLYSERINGKKKTTFIVIKTLVGSCIENIFFSSGIMGREYSYPKKEVEDFFTETTNRLSFNVFLFESCVEDDDDLLDMVEATILFLIKKVDEDLGYGRYGHNWKDSNYGKFSTRIDAILPNYGYKINEKGEAEKIPDEGMEKLVEEKIGTNEPERFENKIEEAKKLFFSRDSTIETRKSAVAKLADVIDYARAETKKTGELSTEIEKLMNIVNDMDFRHSKKGKRLLESGNKDDENFVDWVFYSLLGCINFYLKSFHK